MTIGFFALAALLAATFFTGDIDLAEDDDDVDEEDDLAGDTMGGRPLPLTGGDERRGVDLADGGAGFLGDLAFETATAGTLRTLVFLAAGLLCCVALDRVDLVVWDFAGDGAGDFVGGGTCFDGRPLVVVVGVADLGVVDLDLAELVFGVPEEALLEGPGLGDFKGEGWEESLRRPRGLVCSLSED